MEKIDDPLTYKIIGCAQRVHARLGNGFQEKVYQRALAIEFTNSGVHFVREMEMPLYYDGENVGSRRVDFLVEDKVMVELKALTEFEDVNIAQGLNYLVAYKLDLGLLINFGAKSLEVKRLRHPSNKFHYANERFDSPINPENELDPNSNPIQ